jgi:hypothetical protein
MPPSEIKPNFSSSPEICNECGNENRPYSPMKLQDEFEVLTAVSTKMAVFWVAAPCSLVEVYQLLPDYTVLQPRRQPSSKLQDH